MAFTTRIKRVVANVLLTLLFNGYVNAEIKGDQQQLWNNGIWTTNEIGKNTQNEDKVEGPVDLQSIFGEDWKNENKPIEQDELATILIDIFGPPDAKGVDSSSQSPQTNAQNKNPQFSQIPFPRNSQIPWQGHKSPKEDSTVSPQTQYPFQLLQGVNLPNKQGGVIPASSSYRPDAESTSSPDQTTPGFKFNPQIGIIPTTTPATIITTPSYWYGNQGNLNPSLTSTSVASDIKTTEPTTITTYEAVSSTTPISTPDHAEEKPNVPTNLFGDPNTWSPIVPSELNPIRPNYEPQIPIRPNGFNYHNPQYWPTNQNGGNPRFNYNGNWPTFWNGNQGNAGPTSWNYRPNGYQYNPWNRPGNNFQFNSQTGFGQNFDPRYRNPAITWQPGNQYQGGWAVAIPARNYHGHRHHYHPRFHYYHQGRFYQYK